MKKYVSALAVCSQLFLPQLPPLIAQKTDYTCGNAVLLSFLESRGISGHTEESLTPILGTTEDDGVPAHKMIQAVRSFGFQAQKKSHLTFEELKTGLYSGKALMLDIQMEGESHWALVASIDDQIILMDPWIAREGIYSTMTSEQLDRIWWGAEGYHSAVIIE